MSMDEAEKACAECARTCRLVHRTNSSLAVTSFFKIMIGDDFSRILFLPPKFARAVSALVGQETVLEDSCGQTWVVMISDNNGSLVFQQGWSTFASDHDLEVGDLVLFFRTRESHFVVKIYDRTACEKLNFSKRCSEKKTKRDNLSSKAGDGSCCKKNKTIDENRASTSIRTDHEVKLNRVMKGPIMSQNNTSRDYLTEKSEFVSKAEFVEQMDYMINRDLGKKQGEDRRCIIDLSVYEVSTVAAERIPQVDDNEVAKERVSEPVLSDAFDHDKSESVSDKYWSILSRPRHLSTTSVVNSEEVRGNVPTMSNREIQECQTEKNQVSRAKKCDLDNDNGQSAKKEVNGTSGASSIPISVVTKTFHSGEIMKGIKEQLVEIKSYPCNQESTQNLRVETMKAIKEEAIEIKPSQCSQEYIKKLQGELSKATKSALSRSVSVSVKENNRVDPAVKTEVIDMVDGSSTKANPTNFSPLLATCSQSFVELPDRLPFPTIKGLANVERKTVILRDQVGRLWPVMYHDKPSLQFLASGWEDLSKANCINSGDQCLFTIENESDGIYSVSVVQRCNKT